MKPEGWQGCPDLAVGLIADVFFPFKTPLASYNSFTIKTVLAHTKKKNWKLGLWIDLTNTCKYYNPKQVQDSGVQYIKLPLMGRESPSRTDIDAFIFHCKQFLSENPQHVIGVHCTHGFNRTGFLICSFLCEVRNIDPHLALYTFAEGRPPGIYRQNMVNDFVKCYGRNQGLPPPTVSNPPWKEGKKLKKVGLRKESNSSTECQAGTSSKKTKKTADIFQNQPDPNHKRSIQSHLTEFSSKPLSQEMQTRVLLELTKLIEDQPKSDSETEFPGRCHQFLTHAEYPGLKAHRYMVSWQPQECFRYLLFLDATGSAYLVDTNSSVSFLPNVIFPGVSATSKNVYSTLIDGIVLRRKSAKNRQITELVFESTDILLFEGRSIWCEDIAFRLQLMRQICTERRNAEWARNSNESSIDSLKFNSQPVWAVSNFWKMQRFDWFSQYLVGPNGLVFHPYDNALNSPILKWACPQTNCAHFRLNIEPCAGTPKFLICVDDHVIPIDELNSDEDGLVSTLTSLSGKIVECEVKTIKESKSWVFKRESIRRTCSDPLAFVKSVWLGEMTKNLTTKDIFGYLGSVGSQKVKNVKYGGRNEGPSNVSPYINAEELQDCFEWLLI